jgi:hypothetical protein
MHRRGAAARLASTLRCLVLGGQVLAEREVEPSWQLDEGDAFGAVLDDAHVDALAPPPDVDQRIERLDNHMATRAARRRARPLAR